MDCRTFHRNLEDYLGGGLDFPGRFGIERHARQCISCGKDLADAQKLSRMAKEMSRAKAPPDFEQEVLRRIRGRGLRRRTGTWQLMFRLPDLIAQRSLAWSLLAIVFLLVGVVYSTRWLTMESDSRLAAEASAPEPTTANSAFETSASAISAARPRGEDPADPWSFATPVRSGIPPVVEMDFPAWPEEPADGAYVEYVVPDARGGQMVMRLPKTIRMQHGEPSEEYFIRNVSH